jgi:ERCC4-related helicase
MPHSQLVASRVPLRILALTATPGCKSLYTKIDVFARTSRHLLNLQFFAACGSAKHANIQNVIKSLCISDLVYCDEEDLQVRQYINTRKVELVEVCMNFGKLVIHCFFGCTIHLFPVQVPFGTDATEVDTMLLNIMHPRLSRLRDAGVIDCRDFPKVCCSQFYYIGVHMHHCLADNLTSCGLIIYVHALVSDLQFMHIINCSNNIVHVINCSNNIVSGHRMGCCSIRINL